MNMSNVTTINSSTSCVFLQTHAKVVESVTFAAYRILMPLRFVIGITNQSIALNAFKKQTRAESSYAYQIFVSAAKILEICEFTTYVILKYFLAKMNGVGTGVEWYMSSYALMFISANVLITTQAIVVTLSLALSTAMAADRAFAMVKPFVYRSMNKKRHQLVALLLCIFIACGSSIDYAFRNILVINSRGIYTSAANPYYSQAPWTSVFNNGRIGIRLTLTAVLIISNGLSLKLYKKRMRQLKQLTRANSEDHQSHEARRRKHEKTLFALTIFQAPFTMVNMLVLSANSLGVFVTPTFASCEGSLVLALSDICAEVSDMLEFYVILAASKEFRGMVLSMLPFYGKSGVAPANS